MDRKIVIVDDEVHIRHFAGAEPGGAGGGPWRRDPSQLRMARKGSTSSGKSGPGWCLLDVMMPMMNGYDVCRSIREDPDLADVKVILLTAKGQEADREQWRQGRCNSAT